MDTLIPTERIVPTPTTSAVDGRIVVATAKAFWLCGNAALGVLGVVLFPHFDAFLLFLGLTAITICAGHSVGMHRLLIHQSFKTHRSTEYLLVWLGTLVGMAGPKGMIIAHDMRDWHQRQTVCPPHPAHGAGFWRDAWWQLCCTLRLEHPPAIRIESRVSDNAFHTFLEKTWMLQQVPLALLQFALGGLPWVLWGCCLRIAISLIGHWMVGHFAHKRGAQSWVVEGLPVQGYNLPGLGLITFGENWHGNHHAFPHSARLGVERGQMDPGFALIKLMEKTGLAWDVKTPASEPARSGLRRVS